MHELPKKYRPKDLADVVGQPEAVRTLQGFIKQRRIPHAILLSGPAGCGKTTIARILRRHLGCVGSKKHNFYELNGASFRGIDTIRDITSKVSLRALGGGNRIWMIDECHQITSNGQDALLKTLEEPPHHVYFILATTDPQKLKKTIRSRCSPIRLGLLSGASLVKLIRKVATAEEMSLGEDVVNLIVERAEGSARNALVLLDMIRNINSTKKQIECIQKSDMKRQAIDLARALLQPRTTWSKVAAILRDIDEEAESIRWLVLSYAKTVLLGGGKLASKAYLMINAFRDNFYDSKDAGLAAACWEVIQGE